ncbi:hypothetical protein GF356_08825, partial [candidate division GN15 bacterium]|nr:hypothetical protein [candidate division GN15 bacterium]
MPKIGVFEPVAHPDKPGMVQLLLRFAPADYYTGDGTFTVTARPREAVQYTGPMQWTIKALPDQPHEEVLTILVPPDTVSGLALDIEGEGFFFLPIAYFVHRDDSVEFWKGYPRGPQPPADRTQKPDDTLEIRFSLRDTTQLRQVLEIVGELPDSSLRKMIVTRTTFRQLKQISNLGIDAKNWGIPSG